MIASGEWESVKKAWADEQQGPWSLPFQLSRCYLRFRSSLEVISSGRTQVSGLLEAMGGGIMDVFSMMTQELPKEIRSTYQLHMEGLLDHEIAAVLNIEEAFVKRNIRQAKERLLQERRA
jgi:hypothetical protein